MSENMLGRVSTLLLLGTMAFVPLTGSASAQEEKAPAADVKVEQGPPPAGQSALQEVITGLQQAKTDFPQLEPALLALFSQKAGYLPALSTRLSALGPLQSLKYMGREGGFEIYDVRFAKGNSIWRVTMTASGKIGRLYWRFT